MPSPVQPANSISATSSGLIQWTFVSLRGAPMPVKGDFGALDGLQPRQQVLHLGCAISGSDAADIDEMVAAMDADQQRAELAVGGASSRR